jgi:hypothetical protein
MLKPPLPTTQRLCPFVTRMFNARLVLADYNMFIFLKGPGQREIQSGGRQAPCSSAPQA